MKRYREYKDSGIEWIGKIPSHWGVVSLHNLFDIKAGGDLKGEFYSKEKTENYTYPIYTNSIKFDEAYGFSSKSFFKSNTITVTGRGEIGFATYRDHEYDAIIRLLVLTPKKNAPCKYYSYFINSVLVFFGGNTAVSQLSAEQIRPYKVLTAPLLEQQAIAAFLDLKFSHINSLIAKKKRLINLLKEERAAVINHAVTKGINPNAEMKDSGIEWLGEVPKHWQMTKIKYVTSKIGSGMTPKGGAEVYQTYGIALLRSQNVHFTGLKLEDVAYITEEIHRSMANSEVFEGDVLLNITGASIGRCYYADKNILPANVNQHVCILRPNESIKTKYLFIHLSSFIGQLQIDYCQTGSNREGLNYQQISNFIIPLPSILEQEKIIEKTLHKVQSIDNSVEKIHYEINLIEEYRTALINEAVTGKICVIENV